MEKGWGDIFFQKVKNTSISALIPIMNPLRKSLPNPQFLRYSNDLGLFAIGKLFSIILKYKINQNTIKSTKIWT